MASGATYLSNVSRALTSAERREYLNEYWNAGLTEQQFQDQSNHLLPYFQNYERLCRQLSPNGLGKLRHVDIFYALKLIRTLTRQECALELDKHFKTIDPPIDHLAHMMGEFTQDWIDFAGKSLLLLNICDWPDNKILRDSMQDIMPSSQQSEAFQFSVKKFNAMKLDVIGGMRPKWTSVMSDHLALEMNGTQVGIFHQRYILNIFEQSGLFPDNSLIDEIRRTLNLIFPPWQERVHKWFRSEASCDWWKWWRAVHEPIDLTVADSAHLISSQRNIQKFDKFRDRLIILKEEYEDHEPQSVWQYWHDYRKPARWWAFWIAVLVFVFGLIQIVEGAIQCFKP